MGAGNGKPVLRDEDISVLVKSSGLSEDEVRTTFSTFIKEHPDGKFTKKEFSEMMGKAMPKKDAKKMETHVYRMYDTDGNGGIDFTEFMILFHIMDDGTPEQVLGRIFRVFDVNGDGVITSEEMKRIIKDMYGMIKLQNQDLANEEDLAKVVFQEMDKNKDGKVTCQEFISACLGREEISKLLAINIIDIFVTDDK